MDSIDESIRGLTNAEAAERRARGEGNASPQPVTRTTGQIIRDNVFTLFNLLNLLIAAALFAVKAYSNMAFFAIIVLNAVIAIAQELHAKKLLDQLSILNRPRVTVLRGGVPAEMDTRDTVKGDVMVLESGRQVCSDAVILRGGVEVDESLLTGESDAVPKQPGDKLLSGSSVISGRCYARIEHVGSENYAGALAAKVKTEKRMDSELLGSMRRVTRLTSFFIVPLGIALLAEALLWRGEALDAAVTSSAAALLGMLPKGLVLLISVSLAMGSARLAKRKILVQNIFALETLAHADVLCLDKTGTITSGEMSVSAALPLAESDAQRARAEALLRAYLAASDDTNATAKALRAQFSPQAGGWAVEHKTPFSSQRKWGAVSFAGEGTVFAGAPERLLQSVPAQAKQALALGGRLLAVAFYPGVWRSATALPPLEQLEPLYIILLTDTIRPNASQTLRYFAKQGVDVKIISGDHVQTVSQIAKRAGLAQWQKAVDLSAIDETTADYGALCEQYAVFARVTPEQKQKLVAALQSRGHKVAMTGDGVNDLLALRQADCSIAVAAGSDASRQLAQVVLLESDFTHLPQVVEEGRRVIHNVTRTAGVFFIKTIYSMLLSVFCLVGGLAFPFIPLQITLIDLFIEALPSFATTLEADVSPVHGRFLPTAIGNALPFALTVTSTVLFAQFSSALTDTQTQTVQYLLLVFFSLLALLYSCRPFTPLRAALCAVSAAGLAAALGLLGQKLFSLAPLSPQALLAFGVAAALGLLLLAVLCWVNKTVSAPRPAHTARLAAQKQSF